jgi:L-ascorbate metabolism protein UlaG (beta-lactamase superfamily)
MLHIGGKTVYHCGDTGLFGDMALIGEMYKPDVALIPIGDRFTMGPRLASRAADLIGAPVVVPIHYDTWPLIEVDVADFRPTSSTVKVLKAGEAWEV